MILMLTRRCSLIKAIIRAVRLEIVVMMEENYAPLTVPFYSS